jgi:hypothetical protein
MSAVDYGGLLTADMKKAGLTAESIGLSIQSAHALNEAVEMRRAKIRKDSVLSSEGDEQREKREKREKAEDDRIFLGAALFLAQRMKPKVR